VTLKIPRLTADHDVSDAPRPAEAPQGVNRNAQAIGRNRLDHGFLEGHHVSH